MHPFAISGMDTPRRSELHYLIRISLRLMFVILVILVALDFKFQLTPISSAFFSEIRKISYPPIIGTEEMLHKPIIKDNQTGCITREAYADQLSLLLSGDISPSVSPKVLIVGKGTPLGISLANALEAEGSRYISVGCLNNFDFSNPNVTNVLKGFNISSAFILCKAFYQRFSTTDGANHVIGLHARYLTGIFSYLSARAIPFIYAVEGILPIDHSHLSESFGGKSVLFPHLLSESGALANTAKECIKANRSEVEYFQSENVAGITSDAAASLLLRSNIGSSLRVISNISLPISDSMEMLRKAFPSCNITLRAPMHRAPREPHELKQILLEGTSVESYINSLKSIRIPDDVRPYMSIIVAGRHDNYAAGFMTRFQNSINSIGQGIERNPLASVEMIIVDYATPTGESNLCSVLEIPQSLRGKTRFIIVPPSFHENIIAKRYNSSINFLEFVAKNIGIRRAKGEFILTTNGDDLHPSTFFEDVAKRDFNHQILYRKVRWNGKKKTSETYSIQQLIDAAGEPWKLPELQLARKFFFPEYCDKVTLIDSVQMFRSCAFTKASGDFILLSRDLYNLVGGFAEVPFNTDTDSIFMGEMMKVLPGYFQSILDNSIIHQWHPNFAKARKGVYLRKVYTDEYSCNGSSGSLGVYDNFPDWGAPNIHFEETLR